MLGYEDPAAVAGPRGVVESFTSLAKTNLLQIQAIFRSLVGKPACGMCSTVSPNAMIGRGLAVAGKSFHAASAAVGGLGSGSDPELWAEPHAHNTSNATTQTRRFT